METYDASPGSVRRLLEAFWSPAGWKRPPALPSGTEIVDAVASGLFFAEPRNLTHDSWVQATCAAAERVAAADIEEAFLASLTSRRLDLRSVLGSYAVARRLPQHSFATGPSAGCAVCGLPKQSSQDLNVLSFERFKWGGVRRADIRYVAFDLEQFRRAPRVPVSAGDIAVGRWIMETLRLIAPAQTATGAAAELRAVKANKAEREVLIDILGVCGILETKDHRGYHEKFQEHSTRTPPVRHFVDRTYPACWWTGRDGVNEAAIATFLPSLQTPTETRARELSP